MILLNLLECYQKSEWHKLSEEFDIFINTSNLDNTPVSVMEAMALGLVVVSTNVGGMPYLINNGLEGVLVAPNNIERMTLAIDNIIMNTESTQQLTLNARKKVESFDWSNVKQSWIDIVIGYTTYKIDNKKAEMFIIDYIYSP